MAEEAALTRRILQVNPLPTLASAGWTSFIAELRRFKHTIPKRKPMKLDKIVAKYSGALRKRYEQALESLKYQDCTRADSYISAFLKIEKFHQEILESKPPRVIQGRQPRYNLALMSFLRPFEHWYYSQSKHVVKGKNLEERAASIKEMLDRYPHAHTVKNIDCSKFDSHVSIPALQAEHSCYLTMHNNDPELRRLLSFQLHNKGTTPHGYKYSTQGRRASGDFNTGLGNTIICEHLMKSYIRTRNLDADFRLDGDDLIFVTNTPIDVVDMREHYMQCGFEITVEEQLKEAAVHCQTSLIETKPPIMVRRPHDVISKGLTSQKYLFDKKTANGFLNQLGQCELSLNRGVPVLQAYAQMLVRLTTPNRKRDFSDEFTFRRKQASALGKSDFQEVTPDARVSFELAFGICIAKQRMLERVFERLQVLPW